jgi:tRNA-dependent cyclodipeptide synthase
MKNKALLGFSIGQDSAKLDVMKQDLTLAAQKYNTFTILAADTLQRHTRVISSPNLSETAAYDDTLASGEEWLAEATKIANTLGVTYDVLRWDDVLHLDGYQDKLADVNELYNTDKAFQKAVKQTIGKFITRYQERGVIKNNKEAMQQAFKTCLNYVLEECAAVWLLGSPEYGYTHLQYHYKLGDAMLYIIKLAQQENPQTLQPVVASDLTRNPAKSLLFKPADSAKFDPYQFAIKQQIENLLIQVDAIITNNHYPDYYKREALKTVDNSIRERLARSFSDPIEAQRNSL